MDDDGLFEVLYEQDDTAALLNDDEVLLALPLIEGSEDEQTPSEHIARPTTSTTQVIDTNDVHSSVTDRSNLSAIDNIEHVFHGIARSLVNPSDVCLTLKTRPRSRAASRCPREQIVRFPGNTAAEAWKFTVVVRILEILHEALDQRMVISKRDIYYRDPALFQSQARVDRLIDDIAFTFASTRSALNVTAAAKGLVAGSIVITKVDGSVVDANDDQEGTLMPMLGSVHQIDMRNIGWILIIEKEATFRSVISSLFWTTHKHRGVLVTGKGYPDLATRAFLALISTPSSRNCYATPMVYGFADHDPDGIAILMTYKNGSANLAHERSDTVTPTLRWLGLTTSDLTVLKNESSDPSSVLHLTPRDRRKARSMLHNVEDFSEEWACALQIMLMLGIKAELQYLDAVPEGLSDFLTDRLQE